MVARYLLVFLVGWGFNLAFDANVAARATLTWLHHGWLTTFYDTAQAPPHAPAKRK
jgi:hypothetical protein